MKIGDNVWIFRHISGKTDKVLDSGVIYAYHYGKFVIRTKKGIVRRKRNECAIKEKE